MSAISDYAEVQLLNALLRGITYTAGSVYLALYTTATTDAGGGTEVSAGGYARQAILFAAPSSPGGTSANSTTVTFGPASAPWGTVTNAALLDGSGNFLMHGTLGTSKTVATSDSLSFPAGSIVATLA